MEAQAETIVSCPACGKRYRWKIGVATPAVRCPCGHVFGAENQPVLAAKPTAVSAAIAPPLPPGIPAVTSHRPPAKPKAPPPLPPEAAVPAASTCPACHEVLAPGAVLCVSCGLNLRTGQRLTTLAAEEEAETAPPVATGPAAAATLADPVTPAATSPLLTPSGVPMRHRSTVAKEEWVREEVWHLSKVRDVIIPIALIAAGLVLGFVEIGVASDGVNAAGFWGSLAVVCGKLITNLLLMEGAMFLAVAFMDVTFVGPTKYTVLKLAGIAIGPTALAGVIIAASGGGVEGSAIGILISFGLYWLLFWLLFKLDLQDTLICVFVFVIIRALVDYGLHVWDGIQKDAWI